MSHTVLLVDDDPDILMAARLLLEDAGYRVIEASGGAEALELVETEEPDAMFLDLRMPGMDGWDVLEKLRGRNRIARLPVIVLSAYGDTSAVERSLGLGARAYVRKPFLRADLTAALEAVLA